MLESHGTLLANMQIGKVSTAMHYNKVWGGNVSLYRQDYTRTIHWNTREPNMSLVNP